MEEHLSSLAATHLLQHTLRSLCIHDNSQWIYAVFWRILPRNYPPPKWDVQGVYERSRGNRRNWILVWEDGFCNFAASATEVNDCPSGSSVYGNNDFQQYQGLQPELFFKMSHEIYNYGEGLIGKVAADHSHKWIYKEPNDQEINFLSTWQNSADSYPRTWEAQFQSGVKTIALIAVREGLVQLGAVHKVAEDLSYIVNLRKKFSYIESIPGVLLPHPSSSAYHYVPDAWQCQGSLASPTQYNCTEQFNQPIKITPSMSSLEALLSKLPSVVPPPSASEYYESQPHSQFLSSQAPLELMGSEKVTKEEAGEEYRHHGLELGESSTSMSMSAYDHHQYHHHHNLNVTNNRSNK